MKYHIERYRRRAGLTQAEMAKRMGVSQQTLSRKENGVTNIIVPELYLIRDILRKEGVRIGDDFLMELSVDHLCSKEIAS